MRRDKSLVVVSWSLIAALSMFLQGGCGSAPNPGVEIPTDPGSDTTRQGDTVRLDAKKK